MLTFANYDDDATELLEFLGWKNLAHQPEIHKATMMFRCLHGLAPEYLYSKFTWRDSAYDLRDSENMLNVPLPRTNYKDYQPFLLVSTEENMLWLIPDSVRQSETESGSPFS